MSRRGLKTVALEPDVYERLKRLKRKLGVERDEDITFSDVVAYLLDLAEEMREEGKVKAPVM